MSRPLPPHSSDPGMQLHAAPAQRPRTFWPASSVTSCVQSVITQKKFSSLATQTAAPPPQKKQNISEGWTDEFDQAGKRLTLENTFGLNPIALQAYVSVLWDQVDICCVTPCKHLLHTDCIRPTRRV